MPRSIFPAGCLAVVLVVPCARAGELPSPLDGTIFSFPSSIAGPGSAVSAGPAMAGRWLVDEPFYNPAVAPRKTVSLSPVIQRVSRQDLRADNHQYS